MGHLTMRLSYSCMIHLEAVLLLLIQPPILTHFHNIICCRSLCTPHLFTEKYLLSLHCTHFGRLIIHIIISGKCKYVNLQGKRDFMDVNKLRILRWEISLDYSNKSNLITRPPLIRGGQGSESVVEMTTETRVWNDERKWLWASIS